jgi:hypothetical protein
LIIKFYLAVALLPLRQLPSCVTHNLKFEKADYLSKNFFENLTQEKAK